jgi:hypothetical protein
MRAMRRCFVQCFIPVVAIASSAACGSSSDAGAEPPPRGEPGGILEVDPSTIPVDEPGGSGPGFDGGSQEAAADGPSAPPPAVTSFPNAIVETDAPPGLRIVSARFTEEPSGGDIYRLWLVEVANDGPTPACYVRMTFSAKNAAGAELVAATMFADGWGYDSGTDTLSASCIPPGESAGAYSNAFASATIAPGDVRKLAVAFEVLDLPGAAIASAPTITAAVVPGIGPGYWTVAGTAKANATIWNVEFLAYPRGADGMLLKQLAAFHMETFSAGTTWALQALSNAQSPTMPASFVRGLSFIKGVAHVTKPGASPLPAPHEARAAEQAALRAAFRENAARAGR